MRKVKKIIYHTEAQRHSVVVRNLIFSVPLCRRVMILFFFFLFSLFSFVNCVSLMDQAGQVIDGSAFKEKQTALYRARVKDGARLDAELAVMTDKADQQSVVITLGDFPMMKLRASAPDENGNFYLVSMEYLAGSANGWNEYTLDMLGEGELLLSEEAALSINEDIEKVQISTGRIRRFDTRIVGSEALTGLRNRYERISATVEWMASLKAPGGQTIKEFENYWKPLLFPELVSKKKKPDNWQHEGDVFERAEDINWNTSYTERTFPQELIPVRNSGTMLRDWEEALSWIYLEYEWENIVNILSQEINLIKIK